MFSENGLVSDQGTAWVYTNPVINELVTGFFIDELLVNELLVNELLIGESLTMCRNQLTLGWSAAEPDERIV